MKLENTATLRLHLWSLQDIGSSVQDCALEIQPDNFTDRAWIPQTLGDQVWLWYEFATPDIRDAFLASLPEKYKAIDGFIATNFTQADLDRWTV